MIKVGVIGLGKWGLNHVKSLKKIRCDFIGAADIDSEKKKLVEEYNINFFSDYYDLLDEIDAVTVVTPTDTHFKIVHDCLQRGKHVLVEKPIAFTVRESEELVNFAKKNNLILSVGYLFRFNNAVRRTKELIKDIGEIEYIVGRYIHSTKPPRKDSGVIFNLGIHTVDILNFILGKKPIKVYAKKKNLLSKDFEDSAIAMLDYKDFFANIEMSCIHPEKKRDMWIIAEKEKVYVDFLNQKMIHYPIATSYDEVIRGDKVGEKIVKNEPLRDELEYFIELVEKHTKTGSTLDDENIGRENIYTTKICELLIESAETGKEMIVV